jgi:hypothetical protein
VEDEGTAGVTVARVLPALFVAGANLTAAGLDVVRVLVLVDLLAVRVAQHRDDHLLKGGRGATPWG